MLEEIRTKFSLLRRRAEEVLRGQPVDLSQFSIEDAHTLIHELQVHQIELELQNEELLNTQRELETSRNKYADLYDFAPVGYFTIDEAGIIVEANLTGATMLGRERGRLIGQPLAQCIDRTDQDDFYLCRRKIFMTRRAHACEVRFVRRNKSSFYASLEGVAVQDEAGNVSQCRLAISNISDRKQVEESLRESEKRYKRLLEAVTDYIYTVEIDGGQAVSTTHSPGCVAVTGYTSQEYQDDPNLWYSMIHREDRQIVTDQVARVLAGEDMAPFEHRIIHKDGSIRWVKNTWVSRCDEAGRLIAYDGLISNVTDRKQAEEALAKERNLLRALADNLPDYVYVKDTNSRFLLANGAVKRHLGAPTVDDVVGKTDFDFSPYELASQYYADERSLFQSAQPLISHEERIYDHESHSFKWVLTTKVPFRDSQGRIIGLVGLNRDITELKRAKEAYQMLVDHSLQGLAILQDDRIVFANPMAAQIHGYPVEELLALSPEAVQSLIHPADRDVMWRRLQDHLAGKSLAPRFESRLTRKNGEMRWVETYASPVEYQGKPAVQLAYIDITEPKQAEAALRQSEERFRAIFNSTFQFIWLLKTDGLLIEANQAALDFCGLQAEAVVNRPFWETVWWTILPETQKCLQGAIIASARRAFIRYEVDVLGADDQVSTLDFSLRPIQDEAGEVVFIVAEGHNITERKEAERALVESETRYRAIVEDQTELICRFRPDGVLTFVNEAYCRYFDQTGDNLVGQNFMPVLFEADRDTVEKHLAALSREKPVGSFEHRIMLPGREMRWQRWTNRLIFDDEDRLVEIQAVGRDITERKQAEEGLRQSEARLDAIISTATDAIITIDSDQRIVLFNMAAGRIFQYEPEEIVGRPLDRLLPDRFRAEHGRHVDRFGRTGVTARAMGVRQDLWGRRADGQEFPVEAMISQVEVTGQKFYTVILRDITERKRAEEALKLHTRVLENMVEGVNVFDEQGVIYFTNPAFEAMFGYEAGELIGQHVSVLEVDQAQAESQFIDEIVELLDREGAWFGEFRNRRKDGTPFITSARISLLETPDKRYRVSVQEDITKRRLAEQETARLLEAVSQQREQLRALTRRLTEIQEAERKQLARELHDQVGQNLTALGLNLNIIRAQIPADLPQVEVLYDRIDDSLMLTEQTTERIRDVMANLRPPVLDDYGLVAALRWYGKRFASWGGFTVTVHGQQLEPRAAPSVENVLFRIAQEALTNVAKHAQAKQVEINIDTDDRIIRLVIADDGCGFDPGFLAKPTERQGWGLLSMIERAESAGGHCHIEAEPARGTRIIVEVGQ